MEIPLFFTVLVTGTSLVFCTTECDTTCTMSNQLKLHVTVDGNNIDLSWIFNQSKPIYGFQMMIYDDDDFVTYESPILHSNERSMTLEHEFEGETSICLAIYENSTKILNKKCEKIEIKDLKIIIGILAGTIFLIPCIVGLTYVIYKDHKVRFIEQYENLNPVLETTKRKKIEVVIAIEEDNSVDKIGKKCAFCETAIENKAYIHDESVEQSTEVATTDESVSEATVEVSEVNTTSNIDSCDLKHEIPEHTKTEENKKACTENENIVKKDQSTNKKDDSNEVKNEMKEDNVTLTDEEVSGTTL